MQDMIIISTTAAVFLFGFFMIKRFDAFMAENQRAIEEENRKNKSLIRIAAENPMLVDSMAPAMESCSWNNPYVTFSVSVGRTKHMLHRLQEGTVDLLLLDENTAEALHSPFSCVKIPCHMGHMTAGESGLTVEAIEAYSAIVVLWNQAIPSPARDRVVFALSNDFSVQ
ncbi:MAG: hypothetical protein ACI3V4_02940 [Faecousia sp.]